MQLVSYSVNVMLYSVFVFDYFFSNYRKNNKNASRAINFRWNSKKAIEIV